MFLSEKEGGSQALIIHPNLYESSQLLSEVVLLTQTAGATVVETVSVPVRQIQQTYFIGRGKVEQIATSVQSNNADLVVFNADLSPSQERNLERGLRCRVIDRSRLILDIFASRAKSYEGKLQVELAQLEYISTRLIRGWTHLERQKGGIGLRGPGESQLETDRRLLATRVTTLKKQLQKVHKQRVQNRQNRLRSSIPTLALVGYTNAGKSTLFNTLTESSNYTADQLFATLDTSTKKIAVPGINNCVAIDTVGFIQHLPHKLIESFKATLNEVLLANVLIHVVDAADKHYHDKIDAVQSVLSEIGADKITQIIVFNKIDLLTNEQQQELVPFVVCGDYRYTTVAVSAQTSEGINVLLSIIAHTLFSKWYQGWVQVPASIAGSVRSLFYRLDSVQEEQNSNNGDVLLRVSLPKELLQSTQGITLLAE